MPNNKKFKVGDRVVIIGNDPKDTETAKITAINGKEYTVLLTFMWDDEEQIKQVDKSHLKHAD